MITAPYWRTPILVGGELNRRAPLRLRIIEAGGGDELPPVGFAPRACLTLGRAGLRSGLFRAAASVDGPKTWSDGDDIKTRGSLPVYETAGSERSGPAVSVAMHLHRPQKVLWVPSRFHLKLLAMFPKWLMPSETRTPPLDKGTKDRGSFPCPE
jgi:hypothetical protein